MMNTLEQFNIWRHHYGCQFRYARVAWNAWQACQALNDKRIAELEGKIYRLLEKLGEMPYEQSAYALITEINQGIKKEMEARK